jgi:hypothetical protein
MYARINAQDYFFSQSQLWQFLFSLYQQYCVVWAYLIGCYFSLMSYACI